MNKLRVNLTDIKNIYLSEISLKIMLLIEIYWILVSFFLIYDPIIYISNNYFIFNSKSINNYLLNSIWFIILLIIISTIIFYFTMIYFSKKELLKDKLFLITLMVSGLPTSVMIIITPSNKDLRLFPLQELGYILVYYPYIILFFYFISQIIFRGMKLKKNNFKGQERILNKLKSNKNFSLIYDSKYLKDYDGREVFLYSISSLLTAGAYIVLIVNIFSLFITNNVKLSILTILIFFLFFYGAFFNYHKLNIQYILWTSGIFYKNSKTGVMKRFGEDIFYDKNHEFLGTYKLIQYLSYISFLPNLLVIINNINLYFDYIFVLLSIISWTIISVLDSIFNHYDEYKKGYLTNQKLIKNYFDGYSKVKI